MLDQDHIQEPPKQLKRIRGNEPLLLNDPSIVWAIESGAIALFAVAVKDGQPEGPRRYLFGAEPGEALFGITPKAEEQQRGILAVAVEEAELRPVPIKNILELLVADANPACVSLLEGWIHQIGSALKTASTPLVTSMQAQGNRYLSLTKGDTLQAAPDIVSWVRLQQGTAKWMGLKELTLDSSSGILPFGASMWMQADSVVEVATVNTAELADMNSLSLGLDNLHNLLFSYIALQEAKELERDASRFWERDRLNRQVTVEAIGQLTSVLQSPRHVLLPEGAPLLVAAGAVGKAMGITIRPSARSEDMSRVKDELEAIVRASRIRMRRVLLVDGWWHKDGGPLLAYTHTDNNPVALLRVGNSGYEIFDPLAMTRKRVNAEIADKLAPVAYMFYQSLPDKTLQALDVLQFALRDRFKDLLIIMLTGVAGSLLGMVTPQATGILIDNAIPDANRGLLMQLGLGLLAAAFGSAVFQLAQSFATIRLESTTDSVTQPAVWNRLLSLRLSFFRQYSIGDLESRVSAISEIRHKLSGTTLRTIFTSFFSLLNLGLLFYYSSYLALMALGVAVVMILFTSVSGILMLRQSRALLELKGDIFGTTVQLINGIAKLRVAGAEERAFAYWGKKYGQEQKLVLKTQLIEDTVSVFNKIMQPLTQGLLFFLAAWLLQQAHIKGEIGLTTGAFLAFNSAFATFIHGATELSNTITDVLQVVTMWKRARPILQAKPEVDISKADPGRLQGRITVDHVNFRYRSDGPLILDDVSIHAEPGEFIAFVGPSGSGKSTIYRLLLGFDTPETGTIFYDGQDLAGLDVYAVRRQLGVVLQNGRITSASIFENITSGALVTMDEAWEAARMAGFAEDIQSMPMGMHTVISEGGGNLSGGQRQRLLIARALVLKPRILLFDEATSALDNRTQAIVSESLDKLRVTRVVIAHRLSTIKNADRIYVLAAGRVEQQGTFDELASQEGLFAKLIARQIA